LATIVRKGVVVCAAKNSFKGTLSSDVMLSPASKPVAQLGETIDQPSTVQPSRLDLRQQ
jgi:hypothetical protein